MTHKFYEVLDMKLPDFEKLIRTCHAAWRGALILFGFSFATIWLGLHYGERHADQVSYTLTAQKSAAQPAVKGKTP
jgi:hypothetical protein